LSSSKIRKNFEGRREKGKEKTEKRKDLARAERTDKVD
jgi:hypothetical protein